MEIIRKNKESMLFVIKDIAVKNNVTNYEISKNTGVSEAALSKIMRGIVTNPRKNVIDAIYNYLTTHYPNSNNKGYNSTDDNSQNNTNENNIYTEMIATQRELIDSLKEQISQYRKEIEYLRQRMIKEK